MRLSMDRPQVAAFASLLQRQQAQVASEAGVLDADLIYSYKHTSNGFAARLTPLQQLSGKPSLKNDWLSPRDGDGHGTWCAGAAAGNPVSMQGGGQMSGMAPAARLAVYKIFWTDSEGGHYGTETDIAAAVNQAVADGVDELSLSLGAADPNDNYFNDLTYLRANAAGVFVAFV
ncbi:unnamed protein product [Closterium sp. Naga37s-1]|nr:unnamed protein product [Closterium sp. Naga37s-1]